MVVRQTAKRKHVAVHVQDAELVILTTLAILTLHIVALHSVLGSGLVPSLPFPPHIP